MSNLQKKEVNNNCYYSEDKNEEKCAERSASKVANVAVLCADSVEQQNEPTDYGDAVQNSTPEVTPTGNGSVGLRELLFNVSNLLSLRDLLNFFHVFSPFPLTTSECLH